MKKLISLFFLAPALCFSQTKVAFIGDSITHGYGVTEEEKFPNLVKDILKNSDFEIDVLNKSFNGQLTATGETVTVHLLINEKPNIAIILLGINDAALGVDPMVVVKNLENMIFKFTTNDVQVIVGTMDISYIVPSYQIHFTNIYKYLSEKYKNVVFFTFLDTDILSNKTIGDKIHPNKQGHEQIAHKLSEALLLLRKHGNS